MIYSHRIHLKCVDPFSKLAFSVCQPLNVIMGFSLVFLPVIRLLISHTLASIHLSWTYDILIQLMNVFTSFTRYCVAIFVFCLRRQLLTCYYLFIYMHLCKIYQPLLTDLVCILLLTQNTINGKLKGMNILI